MDFSGQRVTVLGLGRHGGGVAVARFLARRGARVTVTDLATEDQLAPSLTALSGVPLAEVLLSRHDERHLRQTDLVIVNPALQPDNPWVAMARESGVPLSSEMELSLQACPAPIALVTGSNGKSTTAALLAACVEAGGRRAWLAGNIERSLLDVVDRVAPDDLAVLEISSFQAYWLAATGRAAELAILTNLTPNHLDWHGGFAPYAAAKQRLFSGPRRAGRAVFAAADVAHTNWRSAAEGPVLAPWPDAQLPPLRMAGRHQRRNAARAAAAAAALDVPRADIEQALARFPGLPHRLEVLATHRGVTFVEDSQATTPEAATAALEAFASRAWLLVGGRDKGGIWDGFLHAAAVHARGIACYGEFGPILCQRLRARAPHLHASCHDRLEDAFAQVVARAAEGDVVALSPGCASLDQYIDYAHRAAAFRACVLRHQGPPPAE